MEDRGLRKVDFANLDPQSSIFYSRLHSRPARLLHCFRIGTESRQRAFRLGRVSMVHAEKERLLEMHEPRWSSVFIWFLFLTVFLLCQGLLFWSLTAGAWWLAVPLVFIGMFSFMSLSLYRAAHHSHHSYLGTERDEELWPFVLPSKPRWFRCLAAVSELFLGLVYTPVLFFRAFIRPGSIIQNRNRRRRIWIELGLMAAAWGFILALVAYEGWYSYLLMMYAIPATL